VDIGSAFERILDATLAGGPLPQEVPPGLDVRPDPGLRFAMSGGMPTVPRAAGRGSERQGVSRPWPLMDGRLWVTESAMPPRPTRRPAAAATSPAPPPVVRTRRVLAPAECDALAWLRQCGEADLGDDFTAEELKRAYRRLALRYHPDHHVGTDPTSRAALVTTFRRVHDAYRLLSLAPLHLA
jgi:hypothetical protein